MASADRPDVSVVRLERPEDAAGVRGVHRRAFARPAEAALVAVLGHPTYYPRFGFVPSDRTGLRSEYDVPADAFMVAELRPGALAAARGIVRYRPEFAVV